ncbi:hypothetical protein MMC29_006458, partial [Sticta canariensis]|nr:hypothetical protein [Sticta canariensis]
VKHVPPFSKDRSGGVPSRMRFVWGSGATAVVCFILLDATRLLGAPPELNAVLFASERVAFFSRLGDVSMEEVAMRYVSAVMFGVVTFLLFQGVHCGVGALLVGLGWSDVKTWRPCFGTMVESWSLRRFWGMCWHQGLRQTLNSSATFATYRLLGLKHGGLSGKYLSVALVFSLSGAMHKFGDITAGIDWYDSGVIQYFGTQILGLVIEDCVQAAYRLAVKSDKRAANSGRWQHVLRFVWVLSFMAWSVPVYTYPTSRRDRGQGVLPVRVLDRAIWSCAEA